MISGKERYKQDSDDSHLTIDSDALPIALKRAKELQTNLSKQHPSFIKQIMRSHVTGNFTLGVPAEFCRLHLPKITVEVTLEDKNAERYMVKFLPGTEGKLGGGWKRFLVEHKLVEGDVLVFHLLRPCYFKVYIIRRYDDPTVVENAKLTSRNEGANEGKKRKRDAAYGIVLKSLQSSKKDPHLQPDTKTFSLSGNVSDFEKFFKIIVNNEIVDHELSRSIRFKYYKLCCSQKSYLHVKLLKSVDEALAAGIISGMVKLADTIRTCELNVSKDDFATWDNTLEGFQKLGMEVGFLRNRLKRLGSLALEFRATDEGKRYVEAESKLECIEEKMRSSGMQIVKLKRSTDKLEDEMKAVKANIKKCRDDFHEEATAPW